MPDTKITDMYSVREVAELMNVHRDTVRRYIHEGFIVPDLSLPENRDGKVGMQLFKEETVRRFLESCGYVGRMGAVLLTPAEARNLIGISASTFCKYVRNGDLKPDMVLPALGDKHGDRRFLVDTISRFVETTRIRRRK